ncbi:MAG: mechanosensitive ion channel [Planctomycetota bacterium]
MRQDSFPSVPRIAGAILGVLLVVLVGARTVRAQGEDVAIQVDGQPSKYSRIVDLRTQATERLAKLGPPKENPTEAEKTTRARLTEAVAVLDRTAALMQRLNNFRSSMDEFDRVDRELDNEIARLRTESALPIEPDSALVDQAKQEELATEYGNAQRQASLNEVARTEKAKAVEDRALLIKEVPAQLTALAERRSALEKELAAIPEAAAGVVPSEEDRAKREELVFFLRALEVEQRRLELLQRRNNDLLELERRDLEIAEKRADADALILKNLEKLQGAMNDAFRRRTEIEARKYRREAEVLRKEAKDEKDLEVRSVKELRALILDIKALGADNSSSLTDLKEEQAKLKNLIDEAKRRLDWARRNFPEDTAFESWKRTALERARRRAEVQIGENEILRSFANPKTRLIRDEAASERERLIGLREALNESKLESSEHEGTIGDEGDGFISHWIEAVVHHKSGLEALNAFDESQARAQWDGLSAELRSVLAERITGAASAEEAAEKVLDGRAELMRTREEVSSHLSRVHFWLREPSLFSGSSLEAAGREAAALPATVGALPSRFSDGIAALREVEPSGSALWIRIAIALGIALAVGFVVRAVFLHLAQNASLAALESVSPEPAGAPTAGSSEAPPRTQSVPITGESSKRTTQFAVADVRARIAFHHTLARYAIPAVLVLGLFAIARFVRPDLPLLDLVTAVAGGLVAWRLQRAMESALLAPHAGGPCLMGCDEADARAIRHSVGRFVRYGAVIVPLSIAFDLLEASHWADICRWIVAIHALFVGVWLSFRRDIVQIIFHQGSHSVVARAFRSVFLNLLPLVILGFAAVVTLQTMGYRNAGLFYLSRSVIAVGVLLAAGIIFQSSSLLIRRRFLGNAEDDGESTSNDSDENDPRERGRIIARLAGFGAFVAIAAATILTLSWLFEIGLRQWRAFGSFDIVSGEVDEFHFTVEDLFRAGLTFFVGLFIARIVRDVLAIVLRRRKIQRGSRYVIRTLVFYAMVGIAFILALSSIGVRLGQLGWVLGAAGIGIGFGLQEVISNFIAGLILFFERPVQVGDIISVGDVEGDVEQISIRATVIRTRDGISIIVPNKRLITDDVINWSHGDQRTRLKIQVGVAYGSDVPLVKKVLVEVAEKERRVMRFPRPDTQFMAFGESELSFELLIWLATPDITLRRRVRSDLNSAIDAAFREHGIEIPFPQRDLHLRSAPAPIRLGRDEKPSPPAPEDDPDDASAAEA